MPKAPDRANTWARRALVGVGAIAFFEWILAARAYRDPLDDRAWTALATTIADLPEDEPVVLATEWLGPSARMHVPAMAHLEWLARPDLRGWARFHTVGLGDHWSNELARDREDLAAPDLVEERAVGPFTIATYEQHAAGTLVADLLGTTDGLDVADAIGPCRGRGDLRCAVGSVAVRTAEVDYRPRRCLALDVRDGAGIRLVRRGVTTGDVLRGHVGFSDFNARLRNDAPIALAIEIDGEIAARWTVTDEQGWWPFALATTPGEHDVAFMVDVAVGGIWKGRNHDSGELRTVCIEARTLEEGA